MNMSDIVVKKLKEEKENYLKEELNEYGLYNSVYHKYTQICEETLKINSETRRIFETKLLLEEILDLIILSTRKEVINNENI